jgi:hypothetical protein
LVLLFELPHWSPCSPLVYFLLSLKHCCFSTIPVFQSNSFFRMLRTWDLQDQGLLRPPTSIISSDFTKSNYAWTMRIVSAHNRMLLENLDLKKCYIGFYPQRVCIFIPCL